MDTVEYYTDTQNKGFFSNLGAHFIDFVQTLVVFGAIFALIYLFIAQPHKVSGNSMVPTFHNGDYILTDKLSYKIGKPKFKDIIVFKNPRDESQDFIKRIIATPGQSIKVEDGLVYIDGQPLKEEYLPPGTYTEAGGFLTNGETINLGPDRYFALGDNRSHSSDSREWGGITKDEIIGKAFFRYWPPQSIGLIKPLP